MTSEQARQQEFRLVVFNRDERFRVLSLPATGVITIGRGPENTVTIADSVMSRRHAAIAVTGKSGELRLAVEDLGSTNGTWVGGRAIQRGSPTGFSPGEVDIVGSTGLVVETDDPPPLNPAVPELGRGLESDREELNCQLRELLLNQRSEARTGSRRLSGRSWGSLDVLTLRKRKPPGPGSSGAPLALPGPGYLFEDLVRRRKR